MSNQQGSTVFLKGATILAGLAFLASLSLTGSVEASGCSTACQEALGEGGSLRGQADELCPDGWEYYNCSYMPNFKIKCRIKCTGGDGDDFELEIPDEEN